MSHYWDWYRLVLITKTRDFVLLGEDGAGRLTKLESFRLAGSDAEFEQILQTPRASAGKVGAVADEKGGNRGGPVFCMFLDLGIL